MSYAPKGLKESWQLIGNIEFNTELAIGTNVSHYFILIPVRIGSITMIESLFESIDT
jgi:hypothetical protein